MINGWQIFKNEIIKIFQILIKKLELFQIACWRNLPKFCNLNSNFKIQAETFWARLRAENEEASKKKSEAEREGRETRGKPAAHEVRTGTNIDVARDEGKENKNNKKKNAKN